MHSRLGNSQDKLNDAVLNPSYEAKLLVKLAGINKNSNVRDFETGFLVIIKTSENNNSEYWVSESLKK